MLQQILFSWQLWFDNHENPLFWYSQHSISANLLQLPSMTFILQWPISQLSRGKLFSQNFYFSQLKNVVQSPMQISFILLKLIQNNSQQHLMPQNPQDTSSLVFKCVCWSSRLFYIQEFPQGQSSIENSKQSNLTFISVVGYWSL